MPDKRNKTRRIALAGFCLCTVPCPRDRTSDEFEWIWAVIVIWVFQNITIH